MHLYPSYLCLMMDLYGLWGQHQFRILRKVLPLVPLLGQFIRIQCYFYHTISTKLCLLLHISLHEHLLLSLQSSQAASADIIGQTMYYSIALHVNNTFSYTYMSYNRQTLTLYTTGYIISFSHDIRELCQVHGSHFMLIEVSFYYFNSCHTRDNI